MLSPLIPPKGTASVFPPLSPKGTASVAPPLSASLLPMLPCLPARPPSVLAAAILVTATLIPHPLFAQAGTEPEDEAQDVREDLFLALELNDVAAVKKALANAGDREVNLGSPSPLSTAVELNNVEMLRLILAAGGAPFEVLDNPLKIAFRNDNLEMVQLLLSHDALVPGRNTTEVELYTMAIRGDNTTILLGILLDNGTDPTVGLPVAVERGDLEALRIFLGRGALLATLSPVDFNVFALIETEEALVLVDELLEISGDQNQESSLDYLLGAAVATGELILVKKVLDRGGKAQYEHLRSTAEAGRDDIALEMLGRLDEDHTSLIARAIHDESPKLEAFLDRTRNRRRLGVALPIAGVAGVLLLFAVFFFTVRNAIFHSPKRLHKAVAQGKLAKVKKFLASGADPDANYDDHTPLYVAVQDEDLKMARLLIDHGARVNTRSSDELGYTALHVAASVGHIGMAELLLRNGGRADVRDGAGLTPLFVAATAANHEMMSLLVERGADLNARTEGGAPLLTAAITAGDSETATILLEEGADPNVEAGERPLNLAVRQGKQELVETLLAAGADPDGVGLSGATALEVAMRQNDDALATLLRRHGAREIGRLTSKQP